MSIAIGMESPAALGSYTLLRAHIAEKMDRDDLAGQIPNFIRMAEFWLRDKIFHPDAENGAGLVPLSDTNPSNWLLERRADIYVYAALLQAEAHIVNDERLSLWKAALDEALADLNADGNRQRIAAAPFRLRNPVTV